MVAIRTLNAAQRIAKIMAGRAAERETKREMMLHRKEHVATERAAISAILAGCHYLDWRFDLIIVEDEQFVEAVYPPEQHGQPLSLSLESSKADIIMAAWHTVVAAIEHEARLVFTYHDVVVCHPQCGILVT